MNSVKTILVVGASSEIGFRVSEKLASKGYDLILTYNKSEEKIKKYKEKILSKLKINIVLVKLNLLSENYTVIKDALEKINDESLIGMVYCAGYSPPRKSIFDTKLREVKDVFMVNAIAAYEISAIVANKIKLNTSFKTGSIVLISSQIVDYGSKGISAYISSKGALNALGKSLAKELGYLKIRVNVISPGPVETEKINSQKENTYKESIPLNRICGTKDIANLVNFLFTEESSFLNGTNIPLNGGR